MKKVVRMIGLCALVMLAAVSCKKNEESAVMTFRATLTSPTYDAKTYLGPNFDLYWNSGDAIMLYAFDDDDLNLIETAIFTTNDDGVKVAGFSGSIAQAETYFAFYPASMTKDGNVKATSTQPFVPNGFPTDTYAMASRITDGSMDFQFQGLFGLLAIPMKGDATIGSIELIEEGFKLSGDFTLNFEAIEQGDWNNIFEESDPRAGSNSIILDCGTGGYTLSEVPVRAYFVLRPGACSHGFTVVVKDLYGNPLWSKQVPQNTTNVIRPQRILLMPEITVNSLTPNTGDWFYYDNGVKDDAVGLSAGGSFNWGIMFPAGSYQGNLVTKVSMFDYVAHDGTILIYQGGSDAPGTLVGQQAYSCTGSDAFVEWEFTTPVSIDPTENLWIVMQNQTGQYVASCCVDTGDPNGRWISIDGTTWEDVGSYGLHYTWMIRAYVASGAKGEPQVLNYEPKVNYKPNASLECAHK